jgi:hypothetical protein
MRFFRDSVVTDFCSCKIGIQYILYISLMLLLPWMACMQALQEQKPVTKKSLFFEAPIQFLRSMPAILATGL